MVEQREDQEAYAKYLKIVLEEGIMRNIASKNSKIIELGA